MKIIIRRIVDACMTAGLLLLMSYSLLGEKAHEWIGMAMFSLVILHHILNRLWWKSAGRRKKTAFTVFQTVIVLLLVITMLGSMFSGIYLSRYVFRGVFASGRFTVLAERIHLLCAFWGFMLMGLHLGLHMGMFLPGLKGTSMRQNMPGAVCRLILAAICVYGIYASVKRGFWDYLLLKNHFFTSFGIPLIPYMLDYLMILIMFSGIGFLISQRLLKKQRNTA